MSESPENVLTFENDGPLLLASNYWKSEMATAGKLYVSMNAGCFRLLVPQIQHTAISDTRQRLCAPHGPRGFYERKRPPNLPHNHRADQSSDCLQRSTAALPRLDG
jgi:hypothetical protein